MKKVLLMIPIIIALTVNLNATITTNPASGIVGVGDFIYFYTECHDEWSIALWCYGDGFCENVSSAVPYMTNSYMNPGKYTVHVNREPSVQPGCPTDEYTIVTVIEDRVISAIPAEPNVGQAVTFTVSNIELPANVTWNMGDGTIYTIKANTITHTYARNGTYTVKVCECWSLNTPYERCTSPTVMTLAVAGISDQVNLEIAEITLDNDKNYKVIPKNSKNIKAQLRMKMRGTGIVSGFWIVDGQPFQFFNETVYQGQIKTILTTDAPRLPVLDPGMHTITMQLTRPANEPVVFPTLRYYVLPYENEIAVLAPKDGAVIKEDEIAKFTWESALGGSFYQVAFANSIFPLLFNDEKQKWLDCPERFSFTPDAETWRAIRRNQWTYWKVRAMDSGRSIVAESNIQEIKVIIQGAKVGIEKITDMDGNGVMIGSSITSTKADNLLVYGYLTCPGDAEYLILQVYANDGKVDQLLFRDVKKDQKRLFETSVPNTEKESRIIFQVLKSSSPSVLIGYEELKLKHE